MQDRKRTGKKPSGLFQWLCEQRLETGSAVTADRRGRWYVLEGTVDSHTTKSRLLASVPEQDGARWVIDRLVVGGLTEAR